MLYIVLHGANKILLSCVHQTIELGAVTEQGQGFSLQRHDGQLEAVL